MDCSKGHILKSINARAMGFPIHSAHNPIYMYIDMCMEFHEGTLNVFE